MAENEKKVLLSLRNVSVKFNVRGRIMTAIRNVSLDIYENESIAIVGESGSGKSVLTKTFAGMLDANGFIPEGSIIYSDDELSVTKVKLTAYNRRLLKYLKNQLDKYSVAERGAEEYKQILAKENVIKHEKSLSVEEEEDFAVRLKAVHDDIVDTNNYLLTLDKHSQTDAEEISKAEAKIADLTAREKALAAEKEELIKKRQESYAKDDALRGRNEQELAELRALREKKMQQAEKAENPYGLSDEKLERNQILAYEVLLSIGRYPVRSQIPYVRTLLKAFREAMLVAEDLRDINVLNRIFQTCVFYVQYRSVDEANGVVNGYAIIDEPIPFYEIAIHGLKNYTGEPINLAGDYRTSLLECAEYGAGLNFSLMKADTRILQDSAYSCYTGAAYDRWKASLIPMISRYQTEMSGLNSQRITGHRKLSPEAAVTEYEDGTRVYVNYGHSDLTSGGKTIPARDYLVERGKAP